MPEIVTCYFRDVCAVEQALQEKEAHDEKLRQDMQQEKEKVQRFNHKDFL
jgi:hypothetical protein